MTCARPWLATKWLVALALPAAWGCNCDDEVGQLNARVEVEPRTLDFGSVARDSTKTLPLKIRNKGSFQLTISSFSADAPFVAPTGTSTIGTFRELMVEVGFHPTGLGLSSGVLVLHTDDPDAPTVEVPLMGTGIEAAVRVEPAMVDFGEVLYTPSTRPMVQQVTVSNPGTDAFDLTAIELVTDGGGAFGLDPKNAKKTFAPGESESFEVSYTPKALGAVSGSVKLTTTTRAAPEITVPLAAKGVGPVMDVCAGVNGQPELCSTTMGTIPRVNFGFIELNSAAQGVIRVLNSGDRDLHLSQVLVTGNATEFSFTPAITGMLPMPITIPPGQDTRWDVSYGPVDYAFDSVVVSFASDAAVRNASSVRVEGDVPRATIEVRPRSLTFRLSGAAYRSQTPVRIFNCGQRPLELTQPVTLRAVRGNAFTLDGAPAMGTTIPPQDCANDPAGAEFNVVFETMVNDNYQAEITIQSNDPSTPTVTVQAAGTKS